MADLPSGTVTFLFTDIEGSTALWEQDRAAMRPAVDRHLTILRSLIAAHHGVLYKTVGDGTQAAFASAEDALRAAVAIQRAFLAEAWADPPGPLRVRMALHAGHAEPDASGDYLAAPLNRLSRLLATGHGGQILLSQTVQQLTRGALPAGVELRDLGEHRLRDLLESERVFQLWHPDLPVEFSPLQSLEARPTNLPRQPTQFLGREQEVGEISALLRQPDVQLLTLTGAGGTGKTRLALQAAAELLDEFPDGVVFVPLATLADPALVPAAIATALGVREEGGQPLLEQLATFLATKHLLLVIDNWEHLLEAAPVLSNLLRVAPRLTVLATSRAPLHLQAEREYPVPPLALPRRKPPPTLEQLSQYEAVRLFIARAQAVKPDFTIDNESAPAVAEICHRLDGLPLAIELAAARLRLLPPQALLTRLEQRLPFFTGGARDAPARQQTLRQTIAWSHELLSPEEQTLFRRLAVFTGGFDFKAAEAVANPDGDVDVLAGVSALIDHSLVQPAEGAGDEPRFTMLETIREFAAEQIEASGEGEATRERHASFFLTFAQQARPKLEGAQQVAALERLETEHPNLRAALDWSLRGGHADLAVRLAGALGYFWYLHNHERAGLDWLERVLAIGGEVAPASRATALFGSGLLATDLGNLDLAMRREEEGLVLAREVNDPRLLAEGLFQLGRTLRTAEDVDSAEPLLREALELARQIGDAGLSSVAINNLGGVAEFRGNLEEAEAWYEEALAVCRGWGNDEETTTNLLFLGDVVGRRGDGDRALALAEEALGRARRVGRGTRLAWALTELGRLAAEHLGDDTRASTCFREAMIFYQDLIIAWWTSGDTLDLLRALHGLGQAAARLRENEEARAAFAEEQERAMAAGDTVGIARATIGVAEVAWLHGDPARALTLCRTSLMSLREAGDIQDLRPLWRQEWAHLAASDSLRLLALAQGADDPAGAARLRGAAARAKQSSGAAFHRVEQGRHEAQQASVRAALGGAAFTAAWDTGAALSSPRAIAAALAWLEAAPETALGSASPAPPTPDPSPAPPLSST